MIYTNCDSFKIQYKVNTAGSLTTFVDTASLSLYTHIERIGKLFIRPTMKSKSLMINGNKNLQFDTGGFNVSIDVLYYMKTKAQRDANFILMNVFNNVDPNSGGFWRISPNLTDYPSVYFDAYLMDYYLDNTQLAYDGVFMRWESKEKYINNFPS